MIIQYLIAILWMIIHFPDLSAETGTEGEGLTLSVAVPQTISVSAATEPYQAIQKITYTVVSNNGFDLSFSGSSPMESGVGYNAWPQFSKQDQGVEGSLVVGQYDLLPTLFGVVVSGHSSVEYLDQWGGGTLPTGTPQNLVLPLDQSAAGSGGPDEAIGRIIPGAEDQAEIHLYVKATTGLEYQSGVYTMAVTATVVANPQ